MTIYILDENPALCAQYLDNASLDKMIKSIAQVLCNVWHSVCVLNTAMGINNKFIPMKHNFKIKGHEFIIDEWSLWAPTCRANYKWMVQLGLSCMDEACIRNDGKHNDQYQKYIKIMLWARDNVPYLPLRAQVVVDKTEYICINTITPIPLVMPKKYIYYKTNNQWDFILSYRNYYTAKLKQRFNAKHSCDKTNIFFTLRQKPEWLNL